MATNAGVGFRRGEARERSPDHNPKTDAWTRRDAETGRFMGQEGRR